MRRRYQGAPQTRASPGPVSPPPPSPRPAVGRARSSAPPAGAPPDHPHRWGSSGGGRRSAKCFQLVEELDSLQRRGAAELVTPAAAEAEEGTALVLRTLEAVRDWCAVGRRADMALRAAEAVVCSLPTRLHDTVSLEPTRLGKGPAQGHQLRFKPGPAGDEARALLTGGDTIQVSVAGRGVSVGFSHAVPRGHEWRVALVKLYEVPHDWARVGMGRALLRAFGYRPSELMEEWSGAVRGAPRARRSDVVVLRVKPPPSDPSLRGLPSSFWVGEGPAVRVAVHTACRGGTWWEADEDAETEPGSPATRPPPAPCAGGASAPTAEAPPQPRPHTMPTRAAASPPQCDHSTAATPTRAAASPPAEPLPQRPTSQPRPAPVQLSATTGPCDNPSPAAAQPASPPHATAPVIPPRVPPPRTYMEIAVDDTSEMLECEASSAMPGVVEKWSMFLQEECSLEAHQCRVVIAQVWLLLRGGDDSWLGNDGLASPARDALREAAERLFPFTPATTSRKRAPPASPAPHGLSPQPTSTALIVAADRRRSLRARSMPLGTYAEPRLKKLKSRRPTAAPPAPPARAAGGSA